MNIEELLPHRPPMLWIRELTRCTETEAAATANFDAASMAVEEGFVIEVALIECVAQTVAAAQGRRARTSGQPPRAGQPPGMLVSVKDFNILDLPRAGQTLHIVVRELRRFGPMLHVAGEVSCDGSNVATGELTVYA
jgi:predicted hotdog family 3-hydroxylacyl-ACP dehydratase